MGIETAQARVEDAVDILNALYDGRECNHCGQPLSVDVCDVCGIMVEDGCMYCHLDAHAFIEESAVIVPAKQIVSNEQYDGPANMQLSFI